MSNVITPDAAALVRLQGLDIALDALRARAAAVPEKISGLERDFALRVASMGAAREALLALQAKKKALELEIAEAEEQLRKHQRDLNAIKDNHAFKALLTETQTCKDRKDALETGVLNLMEEIDAASAADARLKAEVKKLEGEKDALAAGFRAELAVLEGEIAAAEAVRAQAAAGIAADLLDRYGHLRARRAGLAVVQAQEDPKGGKFSCGGCHVGLTPQKVLDARRKDSFAVCDECGRWLYLAAKAEAEAGQGPAA